MLISRRYRNNLGYQIDVDRHHPIYQYETERYNKNHYEYDGYNTRMYYHKGSEKGLQYGGGHKVDNGQIGKGIDPQAVIKALQLLYVSGKAVSRFYSSETGTKIKNTYGNFMNKYNPNWRPGFAGEKHMLNKQGVTFNYMGPGTNLKARLARGDPPLDGIQGMDAVAKIHDIDYSRARNWKDVRIADNKFIKNIEKSDANRISKTFIKGLFRAKKIGEDIGIVKASDFTSFPNIQDELPDKMEEKQPTINISGQGKIFGKNHDPARKLKNKIKKYRRKKKVDKIMDIAFKSIKKRLK